MNRNLGEPASLRWVISGLLLINFNLSIFSILQL